MYGKVAGTSLWDMKRQSTLPVYFIHQLILVASLLSYVTQTLATLWAVSLLLEASKQQNCKPVRGHSSPWIFWGKEILLTGPIAHFECPFFKSWLKAWSRHWPSCRPQGILHEIMYEMYLELMELYTGFTSFWRRQHFWSKQLILPSLLKCT